jgi:hypothetical protein
MQVPNSLRWILRAAMAVCFLLGVSGHYRHTTAIINSASWQVFFIVLGLTLLIVDRILPSSALPDLRLPFEKSDDDAPTRLNL